MTKTFYDYDHVVRGGGYDVHMLRANGKPLGIGRYAHIRRNEDGELWERKTRWAGKGGTRYTYYKALDAALAAGIAWAKRRAREEEREIEKHKLWHARNRADADPGHAGIAWRSGRINLKTYIGLTEEGS